MNVTLLFHRPAQRVAVAMLFNVYLGIRIPANRPSASETNCFGSGTAKRCALRWSGGKYGTRCLAAAAAAAAPGKTCVYNITIYLPLILRLLLSPL